LKDNLNLKIGNFLIFVLWVESVENRGGFCALREFKKIQIKEFLNLLKSLYKTNLSEKVTLI